MDLFASYSLSNSELLFSLDYWVAFAGITFVTFFIKTFSNFCGFLLVFAYLMHFFPILISMAFPSPLFLYSSNTNWWHKQPSVSTSSKPANFPLKWTEVDGKVEILWLKVGNLKKIKYSNTVFSTSPSSANFHLFVMNSESLGSALPKRQDLLLVYYFKKNIFLLYCVRSQLAWTFKFVSHPK